ncbi:MULTISPECIES: DUF935 domain-containing protein [Agrobacterium]|uniref:DUF935 domain-containing protein n=1 Tax=Agrobacterium salinitolerans TaxID=1183413 RepID=A0ABY3BWH3_9HYPH|nr:MULTISPECIES: DUF935 domain-containing protein [Agrobacterium]TRA97033.1 DUF935 domain-containing protein [Agrobacterium salinitolerans]
MAKIIDQWGNPVSSAMLKKEQAAPTMMGVRRPNTEHQATGLTPAKLGRLLATSMNGEPQAYLELAEDMEERDLHYAGVLATRKLQVSGLEITVVAASEDANDVDNADMVRSFVERDAFESELFDILDAIGKGYSATEIIWETSESQWNPVALKWRDPRWFRFDELDGETLMLRDIAGDVPLAPFKWIVHQAKAKSGLPIRGGLARAVCWTFLFKSFTMKDWAIFCEAYGQPLRLGKWGEGATEEDKDVLLQAVANIGVDYSAIVPASMTVEFIKAEIAGSHELYEKRCDFLDRQVSKVVLGQTGTTDAIAGGYAVGKVHDGVKADIERSDAKQLRASLNRDFVIPYISLNKGPQKAYPKIIIGRPEEVDLEKYMQNVTSFVNLGGKVGMAKVRDKLGIEDPDKDEELLRPASRASAEETEPPTKPEKLPSPKPQVSMHRAADMSAPGDAIDDSIAKILSDDGWEPMVAPIVEGLEAQIARAKDLAEIRAILQERLVSMDVNTLTEILARAAFSARLAGLGNETLSDEV